MSARPATEAQTDVSRLDRIEVVKGSASALYGASSRGGLFNEQSKLQIVRDFHGAAAALYKTSIGGSPPVAWSTSFEPQISSLQDGSIAKPTTGKPLEADAMYQVPGTDILVSAAHFHIGQSNFVVTAP